MSSVELVLRQTLRRSVPSYVFILTICFFLGVIYVYASGRPGELPETVAVNVTPVNAPNVEPIRLEGYRLTKPLLLTSELTETEDMQVLKSNLNQVINMEQGAGNVQSASVFLRKMNTANTISINASEAYNPGSMMKVVVMIAYLKAAEKDASLLSRKILFTGHNENLINEEGNVTQMIAGNYYSEKEIIDLMIINSDNDAMALLFNNIKPDNLNKIYTDLDITLVNPTTMGVTMTTADYAKFFRVLYNATYLNRENSQMALSVLCQSKYSKSFTRNLPKDMKVAHKYGTAATDNKYLSETGIVYYSDTPYLLVVMTKGNDYNKQSDLISKISDMVFADFTAN